MLMVAFRLFSMLLFFVWWGGLTTPPTHNKTNEKGAKEIQATKQRQFAYIE